MTQLGIFERDDANARKVNHEPGREGDFIIVELRKGKVNPWTAWMPFVDTCNPHVAEVFLESTHERYREHFAKHFGREIRYCFTDEPTAAKYEQYDKQPRLPLSRNLLREFRQEHRYDLLTRLADLFIETETAPATRFDYYLTLQRVWTQNFLAPDQRVVSAARSVLHGAPDGARMAPAHQPP